jgi:hypothetical protein
MIYLSPTHDTVRYKTLKRDAESAYQVLAFVPSRQRLLLLHHKGDEHTVRYDLNRLCSTVRATCLWFRVHATHLGGKLEPR